MNTTEIQTRIDAIAKAMSGRTKVRYCSFDIKANEAPKIFISHNPKFTGKWEDDVSQSFQVGRDGGAPAAILDAADAWVAALPTRDEAERAAFMDKLAGVIEHGKRIGIEDGFVNPLLDLMKKLSENALTHRADASRHSGEAA